MSCHQVIGVGTERWRILTDDEMNVVAGKGDILFCEIQGTRSVADYEEETDFKIGEHSLK
ncbi:MAG: hypothetical protein WAW37_20850 [Syntrophobacteraceae bacterium]